MSELATMSRFAPQMETFDQADQLMAFRTSREKVAILLAALSKENAVSLLRKLDPDSIKQLLESTDHLGDLNSSDFDPVVQEFTGEFAEALGISAGSDQLISLLEAAFTQEKVSELLGLEVPEPSASLWSKFLSSMDTSLVPYLLDEHEQTASIVLTKLPANLAVKCFETLPQELTSRLFERSLSQRVVADEVLRLLEQTLEEQFFGTTVEEGNDRAIQRAASVINLLDRERAMGVLDSLSKSSPEQAKLLRKQVFMFEDLDRMDAKSRSKLFDRAAAEWVTPSIWGMSANFKAEVLTSLSARARRMVESELASDDGKPRADSLPARKKIAELAITMSKKGEIALPEEATSEQNRSAQ